MAELDVFAHSDISVLLGGWVIVGENLAVTGEASAVVESWAESPRHLEVMTDPVFTASGIGAVTDSRGQLWICQVFASPTLLPVT
jgi:uncharacterized protein YkwD